MLVQNLINLINLEADELLDNDTDNIPYINDAIDYLSFTLCSMADPEMITVSDITPNLVVPDTFVSFVPAKGYPVYIQSGIFCTTTGKTVPSVKYTTAKPHVSLVTDEIPFKDMYSSTLKMIASYLIKKKTYIPVEYTTVDKSFISDIVTSIKGAKGVS